MPDLIPAPPDYLKPIKIMGPFASFTVPLPAGTADMSPAALLHWIARPHARRPPREPPPRARRTLRRTARFFLEIFSGCGRLSGAIAQRGLRIGPDMDIAHGPFHDLTNPTIEAL